GADARMGDPIEPRARLVVLEDYFSELLAIDGFVGMEDFVAEGADDLFPRLFARLNDDAREIVGIDDLRAKFSQHAGDRALSRCDSTRQANKLHDFINGRNTGVLQ